MVNIVDSRRRLLTTAGLAGTSLLMGFRAPSLALAAESRKKPGEEKEIGAVEDLMREHGVLRRALLVYIETVPRLRVGQSNLPPRTDRADRKAVSQLRRGLSRKKTRRGSYLPRRKEGRRDSGGLCRGAQSPA